MPSTRRSSRRCKKSDEDAAVAAESAPEEEETGNSDLNVGVATPSGTVSAEEVTNSPRLKGETPMETVISALQDNNAHVTSESLSAEKSIDSDAKAFTDGPHEEVSKKVTTTPDDSISTKSREENQGVQLSGDESAMAAEESFDGTARVASDVESASPVIESNEKSDSSPKRGHPSSEEAKVVSKRSSVAVTESLHTNGSQLSEAPPSKRSKSDSKKGQSEEDSRGQAGEESVSDKMTGEIEAEEEKKKRSPELAKFWKAVEEDPTDFTGWTYLLQYVDASGELEKGREAYDAFLFRYPYCYGYWKKYADFEKRKGTPEKCMMVFERGIKAIHLSADLWIHYLSHVRQAYADQPEFIRAQYERAVDACGREWRSDKLWDHYVKWEIMLQKEAGDSLRDYRRVLKLYDRILRNPTQGLTHQFDMFREFVKEHNPKDMLEVSDFLAIRKEVLESLVGDKKIEEKKENSKEEGAPGENDSGVSSLEENQALREKIVFSRRKIFKETEVKVHAVWKFEDNVKRPYFHMKPLERSQLKNWNDYLDRQIEESKKAQEKGDDMDEDGVEILFERCLIACALYEEFWLKFVGWLRGLTPSDERIEKIRDVYKRACIHHLPNKIDIHLEWSAFEEKEGNFVKAADILTNLETLHPNLMSVMLRHINLERRRGCNNEEVRRLYKKCIENAKTTNLASELAIKHARFTRLCLNELETSLKILDEALIKDEKNPKLFMQLIDVHMHTYPLDEQKVLAVFDAALTQDDKKKLSPRHQLLFSQRKVEFLEDFGSDVSQLIKVQEEHASLKAKLLPPPTPAIGGTSSNSSKGAGIATIEGRGGSGSKRQHNGTAQVSTGSNSMYPATNSASYGAQHNSQYQQYGARYASQPQYPSAGYGQYNQYYQGYGSGGSYGSSGGY